MNLKEKIKEKVEIPVFRRCCCCLPLRYGLIAWGYFKIFIDISFIPIMAYYLVIFIILINMFGQSEQSISWIACYLALFIFAIIIYMTDIIMSLVFIVGGHQKKVKLLRAFYIYSIVMLVVTILLSSFLVCVLLIQSESSLITSDMIFFFSLLFVNLIVQFYLILLMRSEIMKLTNNAGSFRFVNNAAEAECTMIYKEKVDTPLSPDTETEDVSNENGTNESILKIS